MTSSRFAADSARRSLPAQHAADGPHLPAQRGLRAAAATSGLRVPADSRVDGRSRPLTDTARVKPELRALLVHPDQTSTRESINALAAAGFADIIVIADTGGALIEPPPDPASDVAAVAVDTAQDAAIDISAMRRHGWQRIVAVIAEPDTGTTTAAIQHGATGAVWAGGIPQSADHVPSGVYDLSTREVEVLRMVADGRANKWIGDQLDLSALTVKSHLARIGRKLGTGERAHMVMLALRAGVIG